MSLEIKAGRLRHRVQIQRKKETQQANGERLPGWDIIGTRWAAIEQLDGTERLIAAQTQAFASHKVTIRWLDGLTTADRLVFDGRIFNIVSIANSDEINYAMEVMAWEAQ